MSAHNITTYPSDSGRGLTIKIEGRFDAGACSDFHHAYENSLKKYQRYAINLSKCTGINCVGLGAILLLKDESHCDREHVMIENCPNVLRTLFELSGVVADITLQ